MKAALLSLVFVTSAAVAQWSNDPADPMVVCNAANDQRFIRAIADADSGYYVFWSDLRNDPQKADLYGQHFDSEGNELWTANGELLMSHPTKSVNRMAPLLMPDGSLIVAFLAGANAYIGDTLKAMRFDADANTLWSEPSVLLTGLDHRSLQLVLSDSCAFLMAYCESCGSGGYGCRMQRVRMDGTVQFPSVGIVATSNYGPYTVRPDGAGGIIHSIRCGNGAGTCLVAQRFDSLGTPVWPGYINLADGNGLNYAFATANDEGMNQTAVWEVNGDLRMTQVDTLGIPTWSPAVQVATDLPTYSQADPSVVVNDDALFVAWNDNRPPASNVDLFLQKYDLTTGAALWATDGIPVIQMNTFLPRTGMVLSDSGAVVVTQEGNIDGYSAMRVRGDGTLAWSDPTVLCVPSFNPANVERVHLPDGNGGLVAFWQTSAGDIYGARVYRNGKRYNDVGLVETAQLTTIRSYPNPATDVLVLDLPSDQRIMQVQVINGQGQVVEVPFACRSLDLRSTAQGCYVARLHTAKGVYTAHFIKN